jgi:hypothetical protein
MAVNDRHKVETSRIQMFVNREVIIIPGLRALLFMIAGILHQRKPMSAVF